jgi:hypothetical protein
MIFWIAVFENFKSAASPLYRPQKPIFMFFLIFQQVNEKFKV